MRLSILALAALALPLVNNTATAQTSGPNWQVATVAGNINPPLRNQNPGAASADRMYVFGGRVSSAVFLNDLWSFDGYTWTEEIADGAVGSPSQRQLAAIAWNFAAGKLTVFGGTDLTTGTLGDTWEWDAVNGWVDRTPATSPSARTYADLAYDPISGNMLLFGGVDTTGDLGDTWLWDTTAGTWTDVTPAAPAYAPAPRRQHRLITRHDAGEVIVGLGHNAAQVDFGDIARWSGTEWVLITPAVPYDVSGLAPTRAFDAAYDAGRGRLVIPCGMKGPTGRIAEFEFSTSTWFYTAGYGSDPTLCGKSTRYFTAYLANPVDSTGAPVSGRMYKVSGQDITPNDPQLTYEAPNPTVGTPFCFGDGSDGVICPCGNVPATGSGEGCTNVSTLGAYITADGGAVVAADTLVLTVLQAAPSDFGIFVQNIATGGPTPFYNGALCLPIDSHLVRHYSPPAVQPTTTDPAGMGVNQQPMTVGDFLGDTQPGTTIYYQFWGRDNGGPCGTGANFSAGLAITWS